MPEARKDSLWSRWSSRKERKEPEIVDPRAKKVLVLNLPHTAGGITAPLLSHTLAEVLTQTPRNKKVIVMTENDHGTETFSNHMRSLTDAGDASVSPTEAIITALEKERPDVLTTQVVAEAMGKSTTEFDNADFAHELFRVLDEHAADNKGRMIVVPEALLQIT